jgi:uncharacterized protein with ParB-like and HNH nuclease domain
MAYQTPITIKEAIDHIKRRDYVLPSIQREFVWDTEQIEMLFDSIMRDYPISTFLFWKVEKTNVANFQFYEFLKKYHEKDCRHNAKIDLTGDQDAIALLDGQQRMTSMYLALAGSYAKKRPNYRVNNPLAYPEKKLYLNVLSPSPEIETEYQFKFLTSEEAAKNSKEIFWFECAKILEFSDISKVMEFLMSNGLTDTSKYNHKNSSFALQSLNIFHNAIHQKGTISYYLEQGEELDKVLQIFIRINSGGTTLSYSDLLLSIATAQWQDKDAREVIHEFVDSINLIGDGFKFNKDIVLKSCLVLGDFDVKFKVDNFTKDNMQAIEKNWDSTSGAMRSAIELIAAFGYSQDNLLATNAIIPIAYFIHKNESMNHILHSDNHKENRRNIKEWLARVLLKGTFGGTPDGLYPKLRDLINAHIGRFPLEEIIENYRGKTKSIIFNEDDIDTLMNLEYGKAKTYCALTLLYPGLNQSFKYHQDHIHPKSFFTKTKLRSLGLTEEKIESYQENFNALSNLQLLQANQNIEKSDKHFSDWIEATFPHMNERIEFLRQNYIESSDSLSFEDFLLFENNRRKKMKGELMRMLKVNHQELNDDLVQ